MNKELDGIITNLGGPLCVAEHINEDDLDVALEFIKGEEEIEGAMIARLFDDEMEALGESYVNDGDWNPPTPVIQTGEGDEHQLGPSYQPDVPRKLKYMMRKKSERTEAKTAALDRTCQVKLDEQYHGQQL